MIVNKTKWQLPEYMADTFSMLCNKAGITPDSVSCVIKRRKHYIGECWTKKGNHSIPNGLYKMDGHTIIIRIGKKTHPDDFRFVLAHEIGHLVDHRKHYCRPTEREATAFALSCGCYPHSKYRGIKR